MADSSNTNKIVSQLFRPEKNVKKLSGNMDTFKSDGVGYLMCAAKEETKKLVLYFHANYGNVSHYVDRINQISNVYPDRDIWTFDYPGFGQSEGSPNQDTVLKTSIKAVKHISKRYSDVIWVGESIGGAVIFGLLKSKEPEYKISVYPSAIFIINTFSSIADLAELRQKGAYKIVELSGYDFPTARWIGKARERLSSELKNTSIWVIRSNKDENIPSEQTSQLVVESGGRFIMVDGSPDEFDFSVLKNDILAKQRWAL